MNLKLRNVGWMVLLIILSIPVGYIYMVVNDKMIVIQEYLINIIAGGISTLIILGTISFITYKILKYKEHHDPSKIALIVYTAFLFILFITSVFQYNDAVIRLEHL